MMWLGKVVLYLVTGFIAYMVADAVKKKQISQMIVVVTLLIILQVTVEDLTPVFKRWNARLDSVQNTLDKVSGNNTWEWPVYGKVTQYFQDGVHHGIDIAAEVGTPIYAERKGYVLAAGNMDVYGLTVIIDYGNNISFLYGHNSKVFVKQGQTILKGTRISLTGDSGRSSGPHLHLEIRERNVPVDPLRYLR